jgi:hypothetical protein
VSVTNNDMKSEFQHVNRKVQFVAQEEKIKQSCETSSELAYKKVKYEIG